MLNSGNISGYDGTADMPALGAGGRNPVGVQIPLPALVIKIPASKRRDFYYKYVWLASAKIPELRRARRRGGNAFGQLLQIPLPALQQKTLHFRKVFLLF